MKVNRLCLSMFKHGRNFVCFTMKNDSICHFNVEIRIMYCFNCVQCSIILIVYYIY